MSEINLDEYTAIITVDGEEHILPRAFRDRKIMGRLIAGHCHVPDNELLFAFGPIALPADIKSTSTGHQLLLRISVSNYHDRVTHDIYAGQVMDHLLREVPWMQDFVIAIFIPWTTAPYHWNIRQPTRNMAK